MDNRNTRIGGLGERAAQRYLEARGYRVLDHNWRSPEPGERGELDLVLRQRRALIVCEVKTRTGTTLAHPVEAVTAQKAARLRRLAVLWMREHRRQHRPGPLLAPSAARPAPAVEIRIDVVAVRLGPTEPFPLISIEHLRAVA